LGLQALDLMPRGFPLLAVHLRGSRASQSPGGVSDHLHAGIDLFRPFGLSSRRSRASKVCLFDLLFHAGAFPASL
jgi:hypothetical protein